MHWVHKDPPAGQSRLQPPRCTRWLFEQRQTQRFAELGVLTDRTIAFPPPSPAPSSWRRLEKRPVRRAARALQAAAKLLSPTVPGRPYGASTGTRHLVCSDVTCDCDAVTRSYKKRWQVEVFHKNLKSNAGLAKSPTQTLRTQSSHLFMSIYAVFKLECLSIKIRLTPRPCASGCSSTPHAALFKNCGSRRLRLLLRRVS